MAKDKPCLACGCPGQHETWEECQAALVREDLRSPARFARPRQQYVSSGSWRE